MCQRARPAHADTCGTVHSKSVRAYLRHFGIGLALPSLFDEEKRDDEIEYLRQSIYLREVDLFEQTLSAFDRFSVRI